MGVIKMKKNYTVLEIEAFRKYVLSKKNKKFIKALYWYLKHKYYQIKELS
jgi:hypothetical protein